VRARVPCFAPEQVAGGLLEPDAMDIDVHALHQGYLRGLRARGGTLACNAEVRALARDCGGWRVQAGAANSRRRCSSTRPAPGPTRSGGWPARARSACCPGAARRSPSIRRRACPIERWPAVIDIDEDWYFKPDAGRILASPADETPSPPCDAQPDEYDIAVLVDRLSQVTTLQVPRIHARWAGLRSFVADRTIVAGFDAQAAGFFWLAGQGGYGIQTAPAVARAAAALLRGQALPADIAALGVDAAALSPQRAAIGAK
jgi:D-arginine dehydrogenase